MYASRHALGLQGKPRGRFTVPGRIGIEGTRPRSASAAPVMSFSARCRRDPLKMKFLSCVHSRDSRLTTGRPAPDLEGYRGFCISYGPALMSVAAREECLDA